MTKRGRAAAAWLATAVFIAELAFAGAAVGQAIVPIVSRPGADTVVVAPGGRGSAAFRLSNPTRREVRAHIGVEAPAGWRLFAPAADMMLQPDSASLVLISFFAPEAAPAGLYTIRLNAAAAGHAGADSLQVRVSEAARLEAAVESAPRWAAAGDRFRIVFRVTNSGNVSLPVHLLLRNIGEVEASIDTTARMLAAGASMPVVAEFHVPELLKAATSLTFRLRATSGTAIAEAPARVDLVPSGSSSHSTRGTIPGRVQATVGSGPRAGSSLRVDLSGALRPGSDTRLDLLMVPAMGPSGMGDPDVYRLGLESDRYTLLLGDQVYGLSPLTDAGRLGMGAEGRLRAGGVEVGAYVQRDRRSELAEGGVGAFAEMDFNGFGTTRVNWLSARTSGRSREVWTGEAMLLLPSWGEISGEYGIRPENGASGRTLQLRLRRGAVSLDVHHVRGDTAFGGRYAGLSQDAATASVHPWRDLALHASVDRNVSDGTVGGAPFHRVTRTSRIGASYGSWIALEAAERVLSGFAPGTTFRTEQSMQARSSVSLGGVSLNSSAEGGFLSDVPATRPTPFWRGRLQASLAVGPAAFSGSIAYTDGPTLYSRFAQERLSATAATRLDLGSTTHLDLSIRATQDRLRVGPPSVWTRGRIRQELPLGHQVSLDASSQLAWVQGFGGEPLLSLNYSVPFRVPGLAAEAGPSGSATVTLVDGDTGAPLPRVVLRVGDLARSTDARGRATFDGLSAGVHFLVLDRATAGVEFVSTTPLPLAVDITEGEDTELELGLVRAATLRARVMIARTSSIAAVRGEQGDSEPLAGALLEFSRGDERFRRVTDDAGTVLLSDLRPGRWTVSIARASLPPFHLFTRESMLVELAAGGHGDAEFLASPKERRVRMVASGEVREDASQARVYLVTGLEMNLRGVSREVYGNPSLWPKIWLANCSAVPDPDLIRGGQTLVIPPDGPLTADERAAIGPEGPRLAACSGEGARTRFRVTGVEFNLREIARVVYGDAGLWPKIWYANRALIPNPDEIRGGQVLIIPPAGPLTAAEREALDAYRATSDL